MCSHHESSTDSECTFCDREESGKIHVLDGAESRRYQLPICDKHWRDYVREVDH